MGTAEILVDRSVSRPERCHHWRGAAGTGLEPILGHIHHTDVPEFFRAHGRDQRRLQYVISSASIPTIFERAAFIVSCASAINAAP